MKEKVINEMKSFLESATPEQMREDYMEMESLRNGPLASDYSNDAYRLMQNSTEYNYRPDCSFVMMPASAVALTSNKHLSQV